MIKYKWNNEKSFQNSKNEKNFLKNQGSGRKKRKKEKHKRGKRGGRDINAKKVTAPSSDAANGMEK